MADKLLQRIEEDERQRKAKDNSKEKDYMDHELNKKTTTYEWTTTWCRENESQSPPSSLAKLNIAIESIKYNGNPAENLSHIDPQVLTPILFFL